MIQRNAADTRGTVSGVVIFLFVSLKKTRQKPVTGSKERDEYRSNGMGRLLLTKINLIP